MSKAVVLGPPKAGKKTLAATIQSKRTCSASGPASADGIFPVFFDTKYYSAQVDDIVVIHPGSCFSTPSSAALDGAEAIIIVIDTGREDALAGLTGWAPLFDGSCSTMLFVLSKVDLFEDGGSFREAAFGWCLDNGFELIDANCCDGTAGDDPRDKSGVPRVIEALESTMWSGMAPKKAPTAAARSSDAPTPVAAAPLPSVDTGALNVPLDAEESKAGGGFVVSSTSSLPPPSLPIEPGVDAALASLLKDSPPAPKDDDAPYERMLDGLDAIMQQVQSVRARAPGASDTDRRQNAAALAMQLAALLGIEDDGEEEEEDG